MAAHASALSRIFAGSVWQQTLHGTRRSQRWAWPALRHRWQTLPVYNLFTPSGVTRSPPYGFPATDERVLAPWHLRMHCTHEEGTCWPFLGMRTTQFLHGRFFSHDWFSLEHTAQALGRRARGRLGSQAGMGFGPGDRHLVPL